MIRAASKMQLRREERRDIPTEQPPSPDISHYQLATGHLMRQTGWRA
jgi:hypothetical protein